MILGIIILKKTYSFQQYVSVLLITFGIILCTLASSNDYKREDSVKEDDFNFFWWTIGFFLNRKLFLFLLLITFLKKGITMLSVALLLSAGMGIIQEKLYKKYGKHPDEALYYNVISWVFSSKKYIIFINFLYLACFNFASFSSFIQ
jgi:solute carrier family 35 (UDP-xylose/UDP-N-acetylglucosamine transporter), member B4